MKNRTELREDLLREAERHVEMLKRAGYKDALVAPEYCIANVIGEDRFYTRTISIYAGEKTVVPVKESPFQKLYCVLGWHKWTEWQKIGDEDIFRRHCKCCDKLDRSKADWYGQRP